MPLASCIKTQILNNKEGCNPMKKASIAAIVMACMVGVAVAAVPAVEDARVDAMVKQFEQMNQGQAIPAAQLTQIKEQAKQILQRQEILKQEALKQGLDKKPEVQAMLKNLESQVYAEAYVEQLKNTIVVSEADLQAKYREMTRELKLQFAEFNSKEDAVKAQQMLLKGANFAGLAKAMPEQKQNLDGNWWPAAQMGQFPEAIRGLVKGQITAEPVALEGKFYLFRVADERASKEAPAFEQIKDQLAAEAKNAKVEEQLKALFKANGLEIPEAPVAAQ